MTITEFLLARIEEDEKYARAAGGRRWASWNRSWDATPSRDIADGTERLFPVPAQYDEHVAQWDPARVLAECEAKRRIVEMHPVYADNDQHDCPGEWPNYAGPGDPCPTLLALASVHADHPDYDAAWAV